LNTLLSYLLFKKRFIWTVCHVTISESRPVIKWSHDRPWTCWSTLATQHKYLRAMSKERPPVVSNFNMHLLTSVKTAQRCGHTCPSYSCKLMYSASGVIYHNTRTGKDHAQCNPTCPMYKKLRNKPVDFPLSEEARPSRAPAGVSPTASSVGRTNDK
jgi:hypothetical protein